MIESVEDLKELREHVRQLVATLNVCRIVVIDDQYMARSVEDVIGLCSELPAEDAAAVAHLGDVDFAADDDVWVDALRETWATLDESERRAVHMELEEVGGRTSTVSGKSVELGAEEDAVAGKALDAMLRDVEGFEYLPMSLEEWRRERDVILRDERAECTMFLVDRDFSRENGTADEGIKLIRDIQAAKMGYCAIWSHTVPVKGEQSAWLELSREY